MGQRMPGQFHRSARQRHGLGQVSCASRASRFYKSLLIQFLARQINGHLVRWACREFKHLHRYKKKVRARLAHIATTYPGIFVHRKHGARPSGSTVGAL
jgi:RNA-directed DNA polymerase